MRRFVLAGGCGWLFAAVAATAAPRALPAHDPASLSDSEGTSAVERGTLIAGAAIIDQAAQALRESLSWLEVPVTLRVLRTPDAVWAPKGRAAIEARPEAIHGGERVAAVMRVRVSLVVDGRVARVMPLVFEVAAASTGAVAAHDLRAGQPISEADVRMGNVNLAAFADGRPMAIADLVGQRAKRDMSSSQAFVPRLLEPMPQVIRGGRVAVEFAQPGMHLEAPGVALSDARTGERARIKLWRDEVVEATVVGANLVRLDEERMRP